jgi:hypothetical protein
MDFGCLSLEAVYETIVRRRGSPDGLPAIPRRGTVLYREYSESFGKLVRDVPGDQAVYLWFSKSSDDKTEFIYVGESHKNRDGLRGRLSDEFKQWYHIFWMTTFDSDRYEQDVILMYRTPTKDYTREVKNQTLKRDATHIAYCSGKTGEFDPLIVQNDLIQLFGNPRGNARDIRRSPVPEQSMNPSSGIIRDHLLKAIAEAVSFQICPQVSTATRAS